jgi:hypothetical protein
MPGNQITQFRIAMLANNEIVVNEMKSRRHERGEITQFAPLSEWLATLNEVLNLNENYPPGPLYSCQIKCLDQNVLLYQRTRRYREGALFFRLECGQGLDYTVNCHSLKDGSK